MNLKIRGGQVCSVPVKYERLSILCFYCGRLGHGTDECVEVGGDCTPEKKFGVSLRDSPWKFINEEKEKVENFSDGSHSEPVDRKLFVTDKGEINLVKNRTLNWTEPNK